MTEIKQIDWAKFGYQPDIKEPMGYKVKKTIYLPRTKKIKRTRAEKLAISDYYNTIDKIRDTIKED